MPRLVNSARLFMENDRTSIPLRLRLQSATKKVINAEGICCFRSIALLL